MSRRLNVDRPVRCAKCGGKFKRRNGRDKTCWTCKPAAMRAKMLAAAHKPPAVPSTIPVVPGRGRKLRELAVTLALRQARLAAKDPVSVDHVPVLVTYAQSVARGVTPGRMWQLANLGYVITPCSGGGNPYLLPRPDGPEPLSEAEV